MHIANGTKKAGGEGADDPARTTSLDSGAASAAPPAGPQQADQFSAPSISPPKGGGAVRGIGEKFVAVPSSGAASFSIPIAVPKARGDAAPTLALQYSSGTGNGAFGLGWSLGVPSIVRKTDKGVPRYAGGDTFVLAGADDLVPAAEPEFDVGGAPGWRVRRYRPRVEEAQQRIEHWTPADGGAGHWRVTDGRNMTTVFGHAESSRIADPADPSRVYAWLACEVRDDLGNITLYQYQADDTAGIDPSSLQEVHRLGADGARLLCAAQRYLKRVLYGNAKPAPVQSDLGSHFAPLGEGGIAACEFCFHVVFDYGEHGAVTPAATGPFSLVVPYEADRAWPVRPDPFSTCRPGFELRTYRRCRRILVFHHFPHALDPRPACVSQQVLVHDESKHLSRLVAFELNGLVPQRDGTSHGDATQALPPVTLRYSDAGTPAEVAVRCDPGAASAAAVTGSPYRWVDLDGEGLSGALHAVGRDWFYRRNLGGGQLAEPRRLSDMPSQAQLGVRHLALLDIDGNGAVDLVDPAPPAAGFHTRIAGEGWSKRKLFRAVPQVALDNPNLRYVDLTGDGLPDILITEADALVWLRSLGSGGYGAARKRLREADEGRGPVGLFGNGKESLFLADMSGDGLSDLVRIRNGSVCYWPSLGYARFGRRVTLAVPGMFDSADAFDVKRIRLADVDGSGTTDIIYLHHDRAQVYANLSGNRLEAVPAVPIPPLDDQSQVDVLDVLGRGTACLVWSSPLPGAGRPRLRVIDLTGGVKPHLLTGIDNGYGGTTEVAYTTSTAQYLADRAAGQRWFTTLAFPVQVVAKVVRRDAFAGTEMVTRYQYRHGFYDGREREFRGFGLVEQSDAEAFPGAPGAAAALAWRPACVTRTWFHTGAWLAEDRLERLFATEYYGGGADSLPAPVLPPGGAAGDLRECARALKGKTLRIETYARDAAGGTALDPRPYAVVEHGHALRIVQAGSPGVPAVIRADQDQVVTRHYERELADPRVSQQLVLQFDDYGHPLRRAVIGYPRRGAPGQCLAVLTQHWVLNDTAAPQRHRLGVSAAETRHEAVGLAGTNGGVYAPASLDRALAALGARGMRLRGAHTVAYWDDRLSGMLPTGQMGARALPAERRELAFDDAALRTVLAVGEDAAILVRDGQHALGYGPAAPTDGAPAYLALPASAGTWWRRSGQMVPDALRFYLPARHIDPFGAITTLTHDALALHLVASTDARGNRTEALIDYRTLAISRTIDSNGNVSEFRYEPNGKLALVALLGKGEGDDLDDPSLAYAYRLRQGAGAGPAPMCVETSQRAQHAHAARYRSEQRRRYIDYTDGSGRKALTMREAEPGPAPVLDEHGMLRMAPDRRSVATAHAASRWIGSGRIVYDNKGKPVRKYEPFFWPEGAFPAMPALREWGVSPALHYDPLSRLVRTDNPDGSCSCVLLGPWQVERWDENDTVRGAPVAWPSAPAQDWLARMEAGNAAQQDAASKARAHAGTPRTEHLDQLGRVARRSTPEYDPATSGRVAPFVYETRLELDIEGRELASFDSTGREAVRRVFDLLGRALLEHFPESGRRWQLPDAANQPAYTWNDRGLRWRSRFDQLRRPTHRHVRWPNRAELLAERFYYGEDMPAGEARDANLRGRLASQFDDAGHLQVLSYDFKGNITEQRRQVCRDFRASPDWAALDAAAERYQAHGAAMRWLEQEEHRATSVFDAANRVLEHCGPDRCTTQAGYDAGGLLRSLDVVDAEGLAHRVLDRIDYNARGQRIRLARGAAGEGKFQVFTRYTYDPLTFRLQELYSWRDGLGAYPYQRLAYTYDPVGNITTIADTGAQRTFAWAGGAGIAKGGSSYAYDALYQLVAASGRELPFAPGDRQDPLADMAVHPADLARLQCYTAEYQYDRRGNLTRTRHAAGASAWVRNQTYADASNRLLAVGGAGQAFEHAYDEHGNMVAMPHLAQMEWGAGDQLKHSARNSGQHVWFSYDSAGQRVRKVFETGAMRDETIYFGGCELHLRRQGRRVRERSTLHLLDGEGRVATLESVSADDFGELAQGATLRWVLADHLDSSSVECDESGAVVAYEEYRPFGMTAFSASAALAGAPARRYRYIGKERDEETGLYHVGARYYAPWLARWISADLQGHVDGLNVYAYCRSNPINRVDPSGFKSFDAKCTAANPTGTTYSGPTIGAGRPSSDYQFAEYRGEYGAVPKELLQREYQIAVLGKIMAGPIAAGMYDSMDIAGADPETRDKWTMAAGHLDDVLSGVGAAITKRNQMRDFAASVPPKPDYVHESRQGRSESKVMGGSTYLPDSHRQNFQGGNANLQVRSGGQSLERFGGIYGNYYAGSPLRGSEIENRIQYAIPIRFNLLQEATRLMIPESAFVFGYGGKAAAQNGALFGGGDQVYIDSSATPDAWKHSMPLPWKP